MWLIANADYRVSNRLWRTLQLLAVACLLATTLDGQPNTHISQLGHSTWRFEDGSFAGAPTVIAQTRDGYIWIGTQGGLYRFDGAQFVPFAPASGQKLKSPSITSLLAAQDGSLWIGTASLLEHWKDGKLSEYNDEPGYIANIVQGGSGTIWVTRQHNSGPAGPLCKVVASSLSCYGKEAGVQFANAGALAIENGGIWVATANVLEHWNGKSAELIYAPAGLSKSAGLAGFSVVAIAADRSIWAGMIRPGNGLGLQHRIKDSWQPIVAGSFDSSSLEATSILFDRHQSLWVGTVSHGIYRIKEHQIDNFTAADGLSSNAVNGLFEDVEGNIWVATTKGVDKFRNLPVVTFSNREGLRSDQVNSVLASRSGDIRIANGNALETLTDDKVSKSSITDQFVGHEVTALLEDRIGRLWSGIDNGIIVQKGNWIQAVSDPHKRVLGPVISLEEDHDGSIWALGVGGTTRLIHIVGMQVTEIIPEPELYAILADKKQGLWFGYTTGDLGRFRAGQVQSIPFHRQPHTGAVNRLIDAGDESVLASTSSGVIGFRNGRPQTLSTDNGLPCTRAYSLVFDSHQTLWISMACGIVSVSSDQLKRWWQDDHSLLSVHTYSSLDGAQPARANFQPTASLSADGRVWFANSTGLQMIDPADLIENTLPPPVHIENLLADQKVYGSASGIRLPPLSKDIEIDYTGLSFVIPQRVRFRYRLEGFDADWQDAGIRRNAFYTGLHPGRYRFVVLASNNDGVWSKSSAEVSFMIQPAFYQTFWFETLCVLVVVLLIWLAYAYRVQRLTAQLQERLTARLAERERIARELHDTLLQGFQGLILRFQSVAKTLDPASPNAQLMESVMNRADEVLFEGRQRVREIRAESSEQISERLGAVAREMTQTSGSAFVLTVTGNARELHPIPCEEIYGIAREALANAFQHSGAERVELELIYGDSELTVRIRDNGVGLDEQTRKFGKTDHWGLRGMRERTRSLGGQLAIWSHEGAGTEIELALSSAIAYVETPSNSRTKWFKRLIGGWN